MKKILLISILSIALISFKSDNELFTGKIVFNYSFTDLKGNDITDKLAPYFGLQQHYFIDEKNYKAFDEKNAWIQLYNAESNSYYSFHNDNTATKYDGATQTSKSFKVTKLDKKEIIAGYECESILVETDQTSILYYFNKGIRTNPTNFSNHHFGEWNKYLEATDGALSLKFVLTNRKNGYIWTSVANEVTFQKFADSDFKFPKNVKLRN